MTGFAGKVAIVTGGTAGIGRATAELLIDRGAHVVITGRDAERVRPSRALFIQHDATDEAGWSTVVAGTLQKFGRLDILVNNAGRLIVKPLPALTLEDLQTMLRVNLDAAFLGLRAVWSHFKQQGGAIVNVSAGMGDRTAPIGLVYSAAKGAQQGLSRAAALEGAAFNIRVNTVMPGIIWSDGWKRMAGDKPDETKAGLAASIPIQRVGEPREVAEAIAYLAGDEARYITGIELAIDGGRSAA